MALASKRCACNCNPCVCLPPTGGGGCLPEFCVPRPCFFDGQVLGSPDLNAIVEYARTHQAILSRLLGGWGILGGLRVDVPESPLRRLLSSDPQLRQLSNNPQIIAGTKVFVSPGVALDA